MAYPLGSDIFDNNLLFIFLLKIPNNNLIAT